MYPRSLTADRPRGECRKKLLRPRRKPLALLHRPALKLGEDWSLSTSEERTDRTRLTVKDQIISLSCMNVGDELEFLFSLLQVRDANLASPKHETGSGPATDPTTPLQSSVRVRPKENAKESQPPEGQLQASKDAEPHIDNRRLGNAPQLFLSMWKGKQQQERDGGPAPIPLSGAAMTAMLLLRSPSAPVAQERHRNATRQ
jgi:hypothetical protein